MTNSEPGRDTRVHEIFADERLSPLKRYALLAVGTPNLGSLILYELVVLLCSWIPGNHVIDDPDLPIIRQGTRSRGGIQIGDGAWIGARVTILDGVAIGEGAVLGAHALATKDIPARTIAQGIPAKVIRDRGRSV